MYLASLVSIANIASIVFIVILPSKVAIFTFISHAKIVQYCHFHNSSFQRSTDAIETILVVFITVYYYHFEHCESFYI